MKVIVVAVFDRAMSAFNRPFYVQARGLAVRSFADEVNRPDGELGKHPADYELWQLGTWDDETGEFEGFKSKSRIALGSDFVRKDGEAAPTALKVAS